MTEAPPIDDARRRDILDEEIDERVRRGMRVESRGEYQAVLVRGRRPNHLLHLILSVLTLGIWLVAVWIPLWAWGGEKREAVRVDSQGVVHVVRGQD